MKNRNRGLRRAMAFVLAAVLAGSSVEIPAAADGDTDTGNTGMGTAVVTAFSELEEGIRTQTLDTGAAEAVINFPEELTVTLELQPAESGVEAAAAAVQESDTQTEPVTQEPVPDNTQTEEGTGTQENPDGTQNQTDGPETDQGTENGTEPVTPPAAADTEQTETPVTEEPGTQQTEAPVTEAPVQQQAEPAEPSGQEGQSAGTEAPAAEAGVAETAAVLQAEPPAEPEAPVTEGQKAPETEETVTDKSSDGGILTSLLDAVFPSMTVHAAESTNVQTVENFTLTGIRWEIDAEKSDASEFSSDETAAGKTYTYVPVLPETVTVNDVAYTLKSGESVTLPEITVTVAEKTDGYGTVIYEGITGDCTWTLYDTDGDGTEDLLVIGGDTPEHYPGSATGKPPWYDYRENIKQAVVEEGVTGLGMYTFDGCTNLKDVTLPSTLVIIRQSAFRSCKSLSSLVILSGVTEIGIGAFENCSSLVSVTLPDTLKNIERFAFFKCGLVEIEIPEGVETIGYRAFCQCYSLQSVILPDTLKSIGEEAFSDDSNLTTIVPEGVQTIGNYAFFDAKAVYNLSDCTITDRSISKKVNYDKITLVENGESSVQRVLPAECVAGSRYAGTRYDASYYYPSGEGSTAWYVQNGENYEKVTSGTSFQNTPTFYYAKVFDDTTVEINAVGESGDSYTLVVKDKETGETLIEGTHYTQEMTDSTDWEEMDTGSLTKTVTVTITGIAGGGYVGTMETTFQISAEAEASVTADGSTKKYPTFEDAWKAAQGKTAEVTLLADVEVSETLTVTSGSNITLKSETDSNYTISGNVFNASSGLINIASGGTLTLKSGTVKNGAGGNNAIAVNGGHFVLNGGTAAATADGHSGVCVYNGGTAEIKMGNVSGDIGVAAASDGSTITISDGNISGRASGVYVSGSGAKITITGGSISASNTEEENGADGAALRIQRTGSALLSGGTYSGAYGIFINNGNSITLKELLDVSGDVKYAYYSNGVLVAEGLDGKALAGSLTVGECGHSYKTWTDKEDGENHIGICVVCGHEETTPHDWNTDGKCKAEGCAAQAAASVTVNGGKPEYYATIEKAWQAAKGHPEGATITLLANAAVDSPLDVSEEDNIILSMADGVTLTTSDSNGCILIVYGGRLTLESGALDAGTDFGTDFGEGIRIYGGTFIMNGGTVSGYIGIEQFSGGALDYDGGFASITNGTVSGTMYGFAANGGSTELTGGTFSGPGASIINTKGKISDILGNGFAYKQNDAWVNDTTVTELKGTVTVEEAPIKSVEATADKTTVTAATPGNYENVTFTAQAELSGNYTDLDVTWKWFQDGMLIADEKEWTCYSVNVQKPGKYIYTCEATCDGYTVTSEEFVLTIIDPNATAYTITIPKTAVAGGDAVSVGINTEEPFNLNGGTVSVSVSDGIDENGKLTLTNTDNSGSSVTSEMLVEGKTYTGGKVAEFREKNDPAVSLSFREPTETDILAGTYEGTVTFSIDYTAEGGTTE